jgi:hypothetical protein
MNLYEKKYTVEKIRPTTKSPISSNNFYFKRLMVDKNIIQVQFDIDKGDETKHVIKYTPIFNIDLDKKNTYEIIPTTLNESELYYLIYIDLNLVLDDAINKSYITDNDKFSFRKVTNTFNKIDIPSEIGGKYEKIVKEIKDDTTVAPTKVESSSYNIWWIIVLIVIILMVIGLTVYYKKNITSAVKSIWNNGSKQNYNNLELTKI